MSSLKKTKYPISREFFPYSRFTPPVGRTFVRLAQRGMKTPRFIFREPGIETKTLKIPGWKDGGIPHIRMLREAGGSEAHAEEGTGL